MSFNKRQGRHNLPALSQYFNFLGTKENAVAIEKQTSISPLSIISGYSSPYSEKQGTIQDISQFVTSLTQESVLIRADVNAHNTLWGYPNDIPRGNARKTTYPAPIFTSLMLKMQPNLHNQNNETLKAGLTSSF
ncbi:hypothetical protein AVEN_190625-1 [Araneus ventricosus]|uniref:Endonuclease/exonuclease/phosphatase domain-containing protein n=1 Tax=Araneus ventricosus TaxID=182803 RepID=A0A4Y2QPN4_ARAVE|nr:hypothetical protein AVEN_217793-1 [Araneus ventricosus]GBN65175.1 hypothetical protein AVEN_190625-1 [Araneus ventricosus]